MEPQEILLVHHPQDLNLLQDSEGELNVRQCKSMTSRTDAELECSKLTPVLSGLMVISLMATIRPVFRHLARLTMLRHQNTSVASNHGNMGITTGEYRSLTRMPLDPISPSIHTH